MPLITFKCNECETFVEKFFHNIKDIGEIICEECGSLECERQYLAHKIRVLLDASSMYNEKIKPDAERIMKKMHKGGSKEFFDIYGEK